MVLAAAYNLGAKRCLCALFKLFIVVFLDVNFLRDIVQLAHCNITCAIETIGDLEWMDALIKQLLGLLKDCSSKHNNTCSTITDFIILGG